MKHKTTGAVMGGAIMFNVSITADTDEMRDWPPETVEAFLRGIAKVILAQKLGNLEAGRDALDTVIRRVSRLEESEWKTMVAKLRKKKDKP